MHTTDFCILILRLNSFLKVIYNFIAHLKFKCSQFTKIHWFVVRILKARTVLAVY